MRIMLIDDEPEILESLSTALRSKGFYTREFSSAEKAVEACLEERFDVVIADIKMPEMSGVQLLKAVREKNPEVFLIILTGGAGIDSAIEALNRGAYAFFCKPLDLSALFATLFEIEKRLLEIRLKENITIDITGFAWGIKNLKTLADYRKSPGCER